MDFIFTPDDFTGAMLRILTSLILLAMILGISYYKNMNLRNRIITAGMRGLIQLIILASILVYIFALTNIIYQFLILAIMIFFGSQTISKRLKEIPGIFKIELIALSITVFLLLTLTSSILFTFILALQGPIL